MKNKRKNIIILLILILLLTLGIGITYAIFKWISSNSDITFNIEGCYVTYDAGGDITGASLGPALSKDDTNNVLSKKITLSPECSGVTANLTLKVNEIAPELKNTSFIWSLYEGNTKVSSGNFADATTNKVYTLLSTKTLTENTTTTYTLYIYIDGTVDNDSSMGGKNFKFTLGASGENALYKGPVNAVTLVEGLDKGTTGDDGSGVYKVQHDAIASSNSATGAEIPAVTDYRYYGPNPNNYICLDMEGGSTCPDKHLYRIIGSIYEEKENTNRIKVIKATPLTDGTTNGFSWDYKVNNGSGSYDNIWATITSGNYSNSLTSGSQLMKLLNSGAWWNGTSGSYYNNSTTATTVNFTNYKLSDKAKSYITTSRYYLGGYSTSDGVMTNQFYTYERGTTRYDTNRPLYWDGMVGLMYPSDYGYAAGNSCVTGTDSYNYDGGCKNKDWLWMTTSSDYTNGYEWLMSPNSGISYGAFNVNSSGYVGGVGFSYVVNAYSARPVFYLTSSASITDGEGTSSNPYILS